MSENTLMKAKKYLKKVGLIDFQSEVGRRNNTIYEIKYLKICGISGGISGGISDGISGGISGENPPPLMIYILTPHGTLN